MIDKRAFGNIFKRTEMYDFSQYEPSSPLNYIHPYKSSSLEKILQRLPADVEMVIVYGSSAQDFQREDSDLDLAVVPYDKDYKLHKVVHDMKLPFEVDIRMFRSLDDLVEQAGEYFPTAVDIINEGILVYCRGAELEVVNVQVS